MRTTNETERIQSRYIPKHSTPIEEPGVGVVYVYPCGKKYGAIGYAGTAGKASFHYSFKRDTDLDAHIERWFSNLRSHKDLVVERRSKQFAGHNFKVGDIVTNSWGYDQTNVDWYRVSKTTKNYVWLKPVHSVLEPDGGVGPMAGQVGLALDENLKPIDGTGRETKHRASGEYVTMRHGCGSKYTGGSLYESWYA